MSYVSGLQGLLENIRKVASQYPDRVKAALYYEAQIEMTESKRRCPVDTGKLHASGRVSQPEQVGSRISVTLSYGGGAITYAVYVHENLEANHASPPFGGGQAKYLESVLNESAPRMAERLAKHLNFNDLRVL